MRHPIAVPILCACVLALVPICETRGGAAPAAESKADGPAAISPNEVVAVGRRWFEGLKAKNPAQVAAETVYPFTFGSTSRKKRCEGVADDEKKLEAIVGCVIKRDKLLMGEMKYAEKIDVKAIEANDVPVEFRKLVGKVGEGDRLATWFINGDGVSFGFLLVIGGEQGRAGVKTFLMDTEVESG
jgi:hypothetical protein